MGECDAGGGLEGLSLVAVSLCAVQRTLSKGEAHGWCVGARGAGKGGGRTQG